jgi:hypothetical protein
VDPEGRDVTIAVKGHIVGVRRDEGIAHNSVECSVDGRWNFAEDNEITEFSFNSTGGVGACEIEGLGPFGLKAMMFFRWGHDDNSCSC